MNTQRENYIESRIDSYREKLMEELMEDIEKDVLEDLEKEEQEEILRIEDMNAQGKSTLHGAAFDKHIKKFLENKKKELYDYYLRENENYIQKKLGEYRKELEQE